MTIGETTNEEIIPSGENNPVCLMHNGAVIPWALKLVLKLSDKTDGIFFMLKNPVKDWRKLICVQELH